MRPQEKLSFIYTGRAALSGIHEDVPRLAKYFGVGIIATAVDWTLFYVLIRYLQLFYVLALVASYSTSTVLSFFMNRRYTFRNTYDQVHFQLASFTAVAVLGLGLNEVLVYGMAYYVFGSAGAGLMASRFIATLVVFAWNFMLNKSITFKIFR